MKIIDTLLLVSDAFCASTGIAEATLSSRVFNDGKRLAAVRAGKDIGARRVERAMRWFSENWPEGADWPLLVPRPGCGMNIPLSDLRRGFGPCASLQGGSRAILPRAPATVFRSAYPCGPP